MMMPFFKVLHTLWLWGLFISSQEKSAFQWGLYTQVIAWGDTAQGAVREGCLYTASARKALGQAAVTPECAMGLNKHREGSVETQRSKSPPGRVCETLFHGRTYHGPSSHDAFSEMALGPPRSLSNSGVKNYG